MFHTILIAAASLVFAGQDAATQARPARQDEGIVVKGKKDPRDKRVCRRVNATGSIMAKSTCRTAGEWEIERQRAQVAIEKFRQRQQMEQEARRQKYEE